jgi:hypothetical protein|tara:strand:- start:646 stop:1317 length:672 start_codon:yes stop_codon:yes gene_type:complete
MAIKILDVKAAPMQDGMEGGDIVGQIVNGVGQVPDYRDLGGWAIRFDDLDVAEAFAKVLPASRLEDHGTEGRVHHVVLGDGVPLDIRVEHVSTKMLLRSQSDWSIVRDCDGMVMADGDDCVCSRLAPHGTPEMRKYQKDGQACKPSGFIVATLEGFPELGKLSFSKNSESTVRPFVALEASLQKPPFIVFLSLKTVESKKNGFSWSVPEFGDLRPASVDDGPF